MILWTEDDETVAMSTTSRRRVNICEKCKAPAYSRLCRKCWLKSIKERIRDSSGYWLVRLPAHPRANNGYVLEHILIAEKALGRYINEPHQVHHVDGNRSNNANSNLVICEDQSYHLLLHRRQRVLEAGGTPGADKICSGCRQAKPFADFYRSISRRDCDGVMGSCKACVLLKCRRLTARRVLAGLTPKGKIRQRPPRPEARQFLDVEACEHRRLRNECDICIELRASVLADIYEEKRAEREHTCEDE